MYMYCVLNFFKKEPFSFCSSEIVKFRKRDVYAVNVIFNLMSVFRKA